MSEVYEVASFYAHFRIIDDDALKVPLATIKVCDSITCFMNKSEDLLKKIKNKHKDCHIEFAPVWEGVIMLLLWKLTIIIL